MFIKDASKHRYQRIFGWIESDLRVEVEKLIGNAVNNSVVHGAVLLTSTSWVIQEMVDAEMLASD